MACFVAGALSLLNFIWAYFALPESLPKERRAQASEPRSRIAGFKLVLGQPGMAHAAIANFLIILAFSGLENTYALYAKDLFLLTQTQVGLLFVFMGFMGAMVQGVFMRRASGRYRETSLAYVGLTLMISGFAGFVIAPALGIWFLLVASACLAIGNGFTQPSISAYVSRLADPARLGETLSGNQSLASLGRVFGPLVAGQLYTFSPRVPFAGCALINLLALFVGLGMRSIQPHARGVTPGAVLES